ncbi:MAG: AMP-binding protein [Streptosporangiales bacterium]|nr:AMP-binding protein [Streptosporangiales bacterium]
MPVERPTRDCEPNLQSYDDERAAFDLTPPERFNPVLDIVESWAKADPDALALLSLDAKGDVSARHTAAELAALSRQAARAFLDLGIGKGDSVFVMLPRVPAWYAAVLGAIRIGAIPMPGPNLLTAKDIAYRVTSADAVAVVVDGPGAAKVDEVVAELPTVRRKLCVAGDGAVADGWIDFDTAVAEAGDAATPTDPTAASDPMLIYFTSGTVAHPKMVLHTQASLSLGHVITARYWHDLRPGDLHWTISDTGWAKAAWGKLFGQWHQRATVVQMDMGKPDADTILRVVQDQGITSFCAPPTLYRMLVLADLGAYDFSTLRHCTSAGEPLNPEVIKVWKEGTGGLTVYDGYGQTETTNIVANYRAVPVRPGSMGKPAPGYEVDVRDDDGGEVPTGEVGNVCVRAEPRPLGLFREYYRAPDATAAVFTGGWYFTGDKARKDADGYFWFEGRSDDVITSSAYRIGPFEVESALVEHPAVAESAVVGKDDPQRTQIVTAFVILAPGYTGSPELAVEIQEFVKAQTAPYKYPREVFFVSELPKTVSGKIRRTELRDWLREGRF